MNYRRPRARTCNRKQATLRKQILNITVYSNQRVPYRKCTHPNKKNMFFHEFFCICEISKLPSRVLNISKTQCRKLISNRTVACKPKLSTIRPLLIF